MISRSSTRSSTLSDMTEQQRLLAIFDRLLMAFGKRNWWPGETPLEVIVGAVLTQNTSWKNVEMAIARMKECGALDLGRLHEMEEASLADIIRSSGFFNLKSRRLKSLVNVIHEELGGAIEGFSSVDTLSLRTRMLEINGLGPETVDSILLYAFERPVFVVDAYTKRFLRNHGLYGETAYHDIQQ